MWETISFQIAAIILLCIAAIYLFTGIQTSTHQNSAFRLLFLWSATSIVISVVHQLMLANLMTFTLAIHQTIGILHYVLQLSSYFLLFMYTMQPMTKPSANHYKSQILAVAPLTMTTIIMILAVTLKLGFAADYAMGVVPHWSLIIADLSSLVYLAATMQQLKKQASKHTASQQWSLYIILFLMSAVIVYGWLQNRLFINDFLMALLLLILYFVNENPTLITDSLTGLLNRSAFQDHLASRMQNNEPFHVITIAMDDFHFINDTYGYYYGDILLKAIGRKLQETAPSVYRLMGDTFCIVVRDEASIMQTINRIKSKLDAPWNINSTVYLLSASFCVVSYPQHAKTTKDMMTFIDYTIQEAKQVAKGSITYGKTLSIEKIQRSQAIEKLLKQAIQENRFDVNYQPIYSFHKKRFVGLEALVCLNDEEYGAIQPAEFLPLAEKNGSILKMGLIVFEKVCLFLKEYPLPDFGIEYIDVNLSTLQCMQRRLPAEMIQIMMKYDIEPSQIHFEVTEEAILESKGVLQTTMQELTAFGCQFTLDDFGKGNSNIMNLIQLPLQQVKIDKSLVWSMASKKTNTIMHHLIALLKQNKMQIVADGVETTEQIEAMFDLNCDLAQGFYYSKVLSKQQLMAYLKTQLVSSS